jgi:hypothetical protein
MIKFTGIRKKVSPKKPFGNWQFGKIGGLVNLILNGKVNT